ncbi:MAG: CinA family protein [Phenylobacterium sp.]|uniref:CinA family protein n=1 Tax=Phenylobacterium sp. TaxID=1871053 RepID=UPI00391C11FC
MAEALDPALSAEVDDLARKVLKVCDERRLRLATAESCTGGLLAALLTDFPGRSHAFDRGFVAYSEEAKLEALGVPRSILAADGAVSPRTARAMAEGALARSKADLAVSITGYCEAGPGPDEPAGLVYFACARRTGSTLRRREAFGDIGRARVRMACLRTALSLLAEAAADGSRAA